MSIEIVTDFRTLIRLAKAVAQAKASGDPVAIATATEEHDAYRELCLRADRMQIGMSRGELW